MNIYIKNIPGSVLLLSCALLASCTGMNEQEMLDSAKHYIEQGSLRDAMLELKNVLQENGENAEARFLLGEVSLVVGDTEAAEKEFRRAQSAGWPEGEARVSLGKALVNQSAYQKVLDEIVIKDIYTATQRADISALRAISEASLGQLDSARKTLSSGRELDANAFQVQKYTIKFQLLDTDTKHAEESLQQALAAYPDNPELLLLGAAVAMKGNNQEGVIAAYNAVLKNESSSIITVYGRQARLGLAQQFIVKQELDQAQTVISPLFKQFPGDPITNYIGGLLAYKQKNLDTAGERLLKVLKVAPEHARAQLLYGTISFAQNNYEQAAYYIAKYVSAQPDNLGARKMLGRIYLRLGQHTNAQAALQPGLNESSDDAELLALVGISQLQVGDTVSGIDDLERAMQLKPDNTELRTVLAKAYFTSGDSAQAITQLEKLMQANGDVKIKYMIVLAYLQAKDYENAEKVTQEMLDSSPADAVIVNLMGAVQIAKGNTDEGRKYFERAVEIKPDYADAALNLARLDETAGNDAQAVKRYLAIVESHPANVNALMALANLADKNGDEEARIEWLEKVRNGDPADRIARANLADYYLKHGKYAIVEAIVNELQAKHPDSSTLLLIKAQLLMAQKNNNQAIPVLQNLVSVHPKISAGHYLSALNYLQMNQRRDARLVLEKAYAINHDDFNNVALLARLELEDKSYSNAEKLGKQLKKSAPDNPAGYIVVGDVHMARQQYQPALAAYDEAWQREPSSILVVKKFQAKRQVTPGESAYEIPLRWLKDHPDDNQVTTAIAAGYQEDGLLDKAVPYYEKCLELQPDNLLALNNLAWIYSVQGNERAISLAERAYQLRPDSAGIIDTYGWVLLQSGESKKALALLSESVQKLPDVPEAVYHHAVALHKNGDKRTATTILEKLLASKKPFDGREDALKLVNGQ